MANTTILSTGFPDDDYPAGRMTVMADAAGIYYVYTIVNKTSHIVPFKYLTHSVVLEPNQACILKSRSALSVYFNRNPNCLCHRQKIPINNISTGGMLLRSLAGGLTVGFTFGASLLLAEVSVEKVALM
ncbi:hypothetical protein HK102_002548 [Quaeritorhiza haematococci]|nr:hypothetical protein HK102_002548 [Quaeritorhiza haematococci]